MSYVGWFVMLLGIVAVVLGCVLGNKKETTSVRVESTPIPSEQPKLSIVLQQPITRIEITPTPTPIPSSAPVDTSKKTPLEEYTPKQGYYHSLVGTAGRFGNQFFRNTYWSALAETYNLKIEYSNAKEFADLGVELYQGTITEHESPSLRITEDTPMMDPIEFPDAQKYQNIHTDANEFYAQTREFCFYLRDRIKLPTQIPEPKTVFIHVRLGDVPQFNPGFDYYAKALRQLEFDRGYISSDSMDHEICRSIMSEFPTLSPYTSNEVTTIQKAGSCAAIVLSHGTFSWLIGFLNPNSRVYYPPVKIGWHGNIFVFDEWTKVE